MKIIKKGKVPDDKFIGTCSKCGTIIEAERNEVNVSWCPKEHYEFGYVSCPVCKHGMHVYPK